MNNAPTTKATFVRCRPAFNAPHFNRLDAITGAARIFNPEGKCYRVGDTLSDTEVDNVAANPSNLVTVKGK